MKSVILMGRLVADPELKTTQSGLEVTSFRIAVDRAYVKSGEERKADFIDIVAWRKTAVFVCQYFSKGKPIAIKGSLQQRSYDAKDGSKRYVTEVVAENVEFVPSNPKNDNAGYNYAQPDYAAPINAGPANAEPEKKPEEIMAELNSMVENGDNKPPLDDDLPF